MAVPILRARHGPTERLIGSFHHALELCCFGQMAEVTAATLFVTRGARLQGKPCRRSSGQRLRASTFRQLIAVAVAQQCWWGPRIIGRNQAPKSYAGSNVMLATIWRKQSSRV